jgi:hypothetical protein
LRSLLAGNRGELSKHLVQVLPELLNLLRSPLIAHFVADVYVELRRCAFDDRGTAVMGKFTPNSFMDRRLV